MFLERMRRRGIVPDVVSFNTVLTAWSRSRLPEAGNRAEAILTEKMTTTVPPDHMTYSIWLRTVVKSQTSDGGQNNNNNKGAEAEKIVRLMKSNGLEPNARDLKLLSVAKNLERT